MREPGEEPRERGTVAPVRRPRAIELGGVLAGLRDQGRIGTAMDLCARGLQPLEYPRGGARGIGLHLAVRGTEHIERRPELRGLAYADAVAEMRMHRSR